MGWLFFDTSALLKRYVASEAGATRVRALCHRSAGRRIAIAQVTGAEVMSGLRRRLRRGEIDEHEVASAWREFDEHRGEQYRVWVLGDAILTRAEQLITAHPLRAYDAVQLATALAAAREVGASSFAFITSDQNQAAAAAAEGLEVELVG